MQSEHATGRAEANDSILSEIARRLYRAHASGVQTDPPCKNYSISHHDAVEIRRRFTALLAESCGDPIGYKIGFTSCVIQEALGIDAPEHGRLFSSFRLDRRRPIEADSLCETYAEPEIAFEMARDLAGPVESIREVLDATGCIRPAIEIVDSRVGLARSNSRDMIADNVLASRVLLGEHEFDPGQLNLIDVPIEIANGHDTYTGNTSNVMGHPAEAVAWLANRLNEEEGSDGVIRAGEIIMSGSCTRFIEAGVGMNIRADFGPLGILRAEFV